MKRWLKTLFAGDRDGLLFSAIVATGCLIAWLLVGMILIATRELCVSGFVKFC